MSQRTPLPEHVTMPLLDVITRSSLDDDYRHVAEARAAHDAGGGTGHEPPWRAAVVVGIFGLLIVTAAVQTSRDAGAAEATREGLIRQIEARRAELREHQREISELREETEEMEQQLSALTRSERAQAARTSRLGAVTGYTPVTGEGVRIRVDDHPSGHRNGIVRDEDLALLVDGLWSAGAEAIAINGRRLTALSGIRTAGSAINVGNVPIRPPYTILAIGDADTLQSEFVDTPSGGAWLNLVASFGYVVDMENDRTLDLPAARRPELSSARTAVPTTKEIAP